MTSGSDFDVQGLRTQFFDYFRNRLTTVRRDDLPLPDRMVLVTACLDALASHWHDTADRAETSAQLSGAERMRVFLVRYGQHAAFERVSAPLLRNATARRWALRSRSPGTVLIK